MITTGRTPLSLTVTSGVSPWRRTALVILATLAVAPATTAVALADTPATSAHLIQVVDGTAPAVTARLETMGAAVDDVVTDLIDIVTAELTDAQVLAVAAWPEVVRTAPDTPLSIAAAGTPSSTSEGPLITKPTASWGLDRIDQRSLPLNGLYEIEWWAGRGVRAYVVDTGLTDTWAHAPGISMIDDGNGTRDCNGHGTHVAGTIGFTGDYVAPAVRVVPVRVAGCDGMTDASTVIAGLDWIVSQHESQDERPGVVNISLSGPRNDVLNAAVTALTSRRMVVVTAAGDDSTDACTASPASATGALTVASSTPIDARSDFSNYGPCVDLFAPGSDIPSVTVELSPGIPLILSGTSMAAAHVSGVAAILIDAMSTSQAGVVELMDAIVSGSTPDAISDAAGTPNRLLSTQILPLPVTAVDLVATSVDNRTLALSWAYSRTGTNATAEVHHRRVGEDLWTRAWAAWNAGPPQITDLTPGTQYEVKVVTSNILGTSESAPITITTLPSTGPTHLTVVPGLAGASVSWDLPVTGASPDSYIVQVTRAGQSMHWLTVSTSSADLRTAAVTGLTMGSDYWVRVAALSGGQQSDWTQVAFSAPRRPSAPVGTGSSSAPSSIHYQWEPPTVSAAFVTGYEVELRTALGGAVVSTVTTGADARSVAFSSLAPLTSYNLRIRALTAVVAGDWGGARFDTPGLPPTLVSVTPAGVTATTAILRWALPVQSGEWSLTGYVIQRATPSGWTTIATSDGSSGERVVISALMPSTTHDLRIAATSFGETGRWSSVRLTTRDAPSAPVSLDTAELGADLVWITWSPPAVSADLVTGYTVQRSSDGRTWEPVQQYDADIFSIVLSGTPVGTRFHLRVAATYDGSVLGPWATVTVPPRYPNAAYVTAVYRDLFYRDPDPAGLAAWAAALDTGTPRVAVANAITGSTEYRSRLIEGVYRAYLGRGADPSGSANWLAAMQRGLTVQEIEGGFIASDEYYAQAGGTPSAWVTRLYRDVLGREASAQEISLWTHQLAAGQGRSAVAAGFLLSPEHLSTVVDGYYQQLLGRGIDPTGRAAWVSAIGQGARVEQIIGGIIASDEYYRRAA